MKQTTDQVSAQEFERQSVLSMEIGERLIHHLEPMTLSPKQVVDLGCAAGYWTRALAKRYRRARCLGVDASPEMIRLAKKRRPWWSRQRYIDASMGQLPLADKSVDLVFSNLALLASEDVVALFQEVHRVLVPNGVFLFSTLGPGCLSAAHGHFIDMHHLGDHLMQAHLADPVMESETVSFVYDNKDSLRQDLCANRLGLMNRLPLNCQDDGEGGVAFLAEVVYGHAFGTSIPTGVVSATSGVAEIPLAAIKSRN